MFIYYKKSVGAEVYLATIINSIKVEIKNSSYAVQVIFKKKLFLKRYYLRVYRGENLLAEHRIRALDIQVMITLINKTVSIRLDDSLIAEAVQRAVYDLNEKMESQKKQK